MYLFLHIQLQLQRKFVGRKTNKILYPTVVVVLTKKSFVVFHGRRSYGSSGVKNMFLSSPNSICQLA
jgi:hypothetical protein